MHMCICVYIYTILAMVKTVLKTTPSSSTNNTGSAQDQAQELYSDVKKIVKIAFYVQSDQIQ